MKLKYQLPQIYQRLLPEKILRLELTESKATCDSCAMSQGRHRGPIFYDEQLKCCTFYPFLPNYVVGGILLSDRETERKAQAIIKEKIIRREFSLPIGLVAPVRYQVAFNQRDEGEFGQRWDWLCPYFNQAQGNCLIWRNRGSVCTSFYCKSSYGKKGLQFWKSLEDYLSYIEMALMEEALAYLDFSPRQVSDLLGYLNRQKATKAEMKTWILPKKRALELWNGYYDEQEEFFKKCYRIIAGFDRKAFHQAMGVQGEKILADLDCAIGKLDL